MKNVDLYSVLNLKPGEDNQEVIKKKFKELITTFHADRYGESDLNQQITEAYKILSSPGQKFIYDSFGINGVQLIKPDHHLLKMYEYVTNSENSNTDDIQFIKTYIRNKIINKLRSASEQNFNKNEISFDINIMLTCGYVDYILRKYYFDKKIIHNKLLEVNKVTFSNNLTLFKKEDNSLEISVETSHTMQPRDLNFSHEFTLNVDKKVNLPFKIFNRDYIDSKFNFTFADRFHFGSSFTLFNIFDKEIFDFVVEPSLVLDEEEGLLVEDINLGLNVNTHNNLKFKYGIFSKNSNVHYRSQVAKRDTLIWDVGLGEKFSFYFVWMRKYNKKHFTTYNFSFNNAKCSFTNSFIVAKKNCQLTFNSSLIFMTAKNFDAKSMFSIILSYNMFKLEIPIIISQENNLFTNSLIFLSTLVGSISLNIIKRLKTKRNKIHKLYDRINSEKHSKFIAYKREDYEKKLKSELELNGLVIRHAYLGEKDKIYSISQHLLVFESYKNTDQNIADIKVQLCLNIVQSKLNLPTNIFDIEGIFNPDYLNRNNLAIVIFYTYNRKSHTLFKLNNESYTEIPI